MLLQDLFHNPRSPIQGKPCTDDSHHKVMRGHGSTTTVWNLSIQEKFRVGPEPPQAARGPMCTQKPSASVSDPHKLPTHMGGRSGAASLPGSGDPICHRDLLQEEKGKSIKFYSGGETKNTMLYSGVHSLTVLNRNKLHHKMQNKGKFPKSRFSPICRNKELSVKSLEQ